MDLRLSCLRWNRAHLVSMLVGMLNGPMALAEGLDLHGQATWIWQSKSAFFAPYSGPHSLSNLQEKSYSFTSTVSAGWRAGPNTEMYLNPEVVQGMPLSGLAGLGGLTNGELQKTAGPKPVTYLARAFVRHTWSSEQDPGDDVDLQPAGFNQLSARYPTHRWVLSVGQLSVSDVFDLNRFAHDARTQFLNWSFLTHGAYDFAADAKGYSQGISVERYLGDWVWRWGRFKVPRESNGLALDNQWMSHFGDQIEMQHDHDLSGRKGSVRFLIYRNQAVMAAFDDAWVAKPGGTWVIRDLGEVRRRQSKTGWGWSLDQDLIQGVGGFLRWARHDGKTEGYSFASIDRSFSVGMRFSNSAWLHPNEEWALAVAVNGLSQAHRRYLSAGGVDFFVGDGALRYSTERIVEALYSLPVGESVRASLNFQQIQNPGYNQDRGPVRLAAIRLHAEF